MGKNLNEITKGCSLDDMRTFAAAGFNAGITDPEISSNCDAICSYLKMLKTGKQYARKSNARRLPMGAVVTENKDLCVLADNNGFCSFEMLNFSRDGYESGKSSFGYTVILNEDGKYHLYKVSMGQSKYESNKRQIQQIKEYFFNYEPRKEDPAYSKVVYSRAKNFGKEDAPYVKCRKAMQELLQAGLDFDGSKFCAM